MNDQGRISPFMIKHKKSDEVLENYELQGIIIWSNTKFSDLTS